MFIKNCQLQLINMSNIWKKCKIKNKRLQKRKCWWKNGSCTALLHNIHSVAPSSNSAKTFSIKIYCERVYFQRAALYLWSKVLKTLCGRCNLGIIFFCCCFFLSSRMFYLINRIEHEYICCDTDLVINTCFWILNPHKCHI